MLGREIAVVGREIAVEGELTVEMMDTSESAIRFDNNLLQAALCHRCGTKIYPASDMEAHMDRHQVKDMFLEGELKKLQYSMNRMR